MEWTTSATTAITVTTTITTTATTAAIKRYLGNETDSGTCVEIEVFKAMLGGHRSRTDLKFIAIPFEPAPFSPVHKHRKFSAVRGTIVAAKVITMRPIIFPFTAMSKNTRGQLGW